MASDISARLIEQHLPELHRQLWAQTAAELAAKLAASVGPDRIDVQHQLDLHHANRHRPETSRAAIERQAEANARKGARHGE